MFSQFMKNISGGTRGPEGSCMGCRQPEDEGICRHHREDPVDGEQDEGRQWHCGAGRDGDDVLHRLILPFRL